MVNELYGWQHSPQGSGKLILCGWWDNPLLFSIRKASIKLCKHSCPQPDLCKLVCNEWLLKEPACKRKQNLSIITPESSMKLQRKWRTAQIGKQCWWRGLFKLMYTHIALEPVSELCGYLGVRCQVEHTLLIFFVFFCHRWHNILQARTHSSFLLELPDTH